MGASAFRRLECDRQHRDDLRRAIVLDGRNLRWILCRNLRKRVPQPPMILMYTAWSYDVFRGKVRAGDGYH